MVIISKNIQKNNKCVLLKPPGDVRVKIVRETLVDFLSIFHITMMSLFIATLVLLSAQICSTFRLRTQTVGSRLSLQMSSVVDLSKSNIPRRIKRALRSAKDAATFTSAVLTPEVDGMLI